jgi:hypothetical protein
MVIIDIFSFIGGFSAKLYDDIEDNVYFSDFKKNKFLMELLKGLHYVSFMTVGMTDNLFYFISYIANLFNLIGNNHAYSNPYEHSLIYTFSVGLLALNYTKIYESIKLIKLYSINTFGILFFIGFMVIEPLFLNSEVSLLKLCFRVSSSLICLFLYLMCDMPTLKNIFIYCFGYLICSSGIQFISLNKEIKKLKENNDSESSSIEDKNNMDEFINYILSQIDNLSKINEKLHSVGFEPTRSSMSNRS